MFAVFGTPGSSHHTYEHFPATKGSGKTVAQATAQAERWLEAHASEFQTEHPAAWPQPCNIISDKEARSIRYRDGRRVYRYDYERGY